MTMYRGDGFNPITTEQIRRGLELGWYVDGQEIAVLLSAIDHLLADRYLRSLDVLEPAPIGFKPNPGPDFLQQARERLLEEGYISLANFVDEALHNALLALADGACPDSDCELCLITLTYRRTQL